MRIHTKIRKTGGFHSDFLGLGSDDLDRIASRVADIYEIEVDDISLKGKQQKKVKARSLFCYSSSS